MSRRLAFWMALVAPVAMVSLGSGCSKTKPVGMASGAGGAAVSGGEAAAKGWPMACGAFCKRLMSCMPPEEQADPSSQQADCVKECESTPAPPNPDGKMLAILMECAAKNPDCGNFKDCAMERMQALAQDSAQRQEDPNALYKMPLGRAPRVGASEPLVTIVAFLDAQCHYCKMSVPVLDALLKRFPKDVRLVLNAFPLGGNDLSSRAAQVGLEVFAQKGPTAFWDYQKRIFGQERLEEKAILEAAVAAGADRKKVRAALDQGRWKGEVEAETALGTRFGVQGTPSFFVNGKKYPGYLPLEEFVQVVQRAAEEARKVAGKSGRTGLYERLVAKGEEKVKYLEGPQAAPGELDPKVAFLVPVTAEMPQKGPADALVTIVEFCDFQCPFCRKLSTTLDQLAKLYPRDVRIVFRHLPLPMHPQAFMAAEAAMAAFAQQGNKGFWLFHDKLFQNQDDLSLVALERIAKEVGLDIGRYRKSLSLHQFEARIKKDVAFAERFQIQGTPQMFINGHALAGAYPIDELKKVVEERLAEAKRLLENGVPRARVYETIMARAKKAPVFVR